MKITLNGNVNRTYVQSLCMAFFHGIKFPQNNEGDDGLELTVNADAFDGKISVKALLKKFDKCFSSEVSYIQDSFETAERAYKTAVGQAVYKTCKDSTGKDIEWGILTGIRPSTVCAQLLEQCSPEQTEKILTQKYLLNSEKAALAIEVAQNEKAIMSLTDDRACSIYISIPFCPSRCTYCSFISYAGKKLFDLIPEYVKRLCADIEHTVALIKRTGLKISCIYIGGGTPTVLDESQLEAVLKAIYGCVDVSALDEFTLEGGRPDTITEGKLALAKKYGITRISVNPQTLNDYVLEKIGRKHTVSEFLSAFEKVKKSGIKSINTDLIAGLDCDSYDSFKSTVDKIILLSPDNVTVHSFCVKKSAQIRSDDENIYNKDGTVARKSVAYAYEALRKSGYIPYYMYRQKNTIGNLENIGYAKKGHLGLYNVFMMSDVHTVFGIGAGATTKLIKSTDGKNEILRIFSPKYPYEYLRDNQKTDEDIEKFFDRR